MSDVQHELFVHLLSFGAAKLTVAVVTTQETEVSMVTMVTREIGKREKFVRTVSRDWTSLITLCFKSDH